MGGQKVDERSEARSEEEKESEISDESQGCSGGYSCPPADGPQPCLLLDSRVGHCCPTGLGNQGWPTLWDWPKKLGFGPWVVCAFVAVVKYRYLKYCEGL